ncbi:cation:dicarboxylate symporter family transporter, partial [Xenorhabdus griffiniae]
MNKTETVNKKKFKFGLGWQILAALILGIIAGAILHDNEHKQWLIVNVLSPAGKIFIQLIKMIVVPIVISTLVVGIAGVGTGRDLTFLARLLRLNKDQ